MHGRVVEVQWEDERQNPGVERQEMNRGAADVGNRHIRPATTRRNRDAADLLDFGEGGDGRIAEQGRRDTKAGDDTVQAVP